jgi:hypothetical protein
MPEKIAFLFLTRGEVNNVNVWERYFKNVDDSKYRLVIHSKNPNNLTSSLWTGKNSTILKPIPTAWGTISLVKATIYLLQTAISDPSVSKFILLSEFCLPTTNFNNMYNTVISELNRSRINWLVGKNMDRYNIIKSYLHMPAHNWAKQSQWMCLDRKHVSILLSPINTNILNQQLKDYMYCPAPDEHFFINIFLYVIRINAAEIINHPITFVDWSNNSKHPVTFSTIVKEVIDICRKNKIFFARKFLQIPLSNKEIDYILESETVTVTVTNTEYRPVEPNNVFSRPESPKFTHGNVVKEVPVTIPVATNLPLPVNVPPVHDVCRNVLEVLNKPEINENENENRHIKIVSHSTETQNTSIVSDKQKKAVLDFFTGIVDNLSSEKISIIYSALFDEDVPNTNTNTNKNGFDIRETSIKSTELPFNMSLYNGVISNPLDVLTLAVETLESQKIL